MRSRLVHTSTTHVGLVDSNSKRSIATLALRVILSVGTGTNQALTGGQGKLGVVCSTKRNVGVHVDLAGEED